MLTIINPQNNRQSDYSKHSLTTEAKHLVKHAAESDGKLRGWSIVVVGSNVALRADYLTTDGQPQTVHTAL